LNAELPGYRGLRAQGALTVLCHLAGMLAQVIVGRAKRSVPAISHFRCGGHAFALPALHPQPACDRDHSAAPSGLYDERHHRGDP